MKFEKFYYTVEQLAEHWSISAEEVVGLGETERLSFMALADWSYPESNIFLVREHTVINHEEVSRIYSAEEPYTFTGKAQETLNGILMGEECIITYYPGISRLIIKADEVYRFEKDEMLQQNSEFTEVEAVTISNQEREKACKVEEKKFIKNIVAPYILFPLKNTPSCHQ